MMDTYLRCGALVLVAVVLAPMLNRQGRDFAALLSMAACVLLCGAVMEFLEPVLELLEQLRRLGDVDSQALSIMLKAALIGLLGELAAMICNDAGEHALGRGLQLVGSAATLWLSLPLFQQILTLIEGVLSEI